MARLLLLILTVSLAACSSGVSNSGAGGAGTDCSSVDLICTAELQPESFSSDAFATVEEGQEGDEQTSDNVELISADFADMTITLSDPLGRFSRVFQGATFTLFRINFLRVNGGAPNLGQRDIADSLSITLADGTGTGTVNLPLVDNVTKQEFRDQASGSTVFVYTVRVRAFGRDFATNSRIIVEARTTIEIGEFVGTDG